MTDARPDRRGSGWATPGRRTTGAAAPLPAPVQRLVRAAAVLAVVAAGLAAATAPGAGADPNTWSPTGGLNVPRYGHGAVLLPTGKVLVTGGVGGSNFESLRSAELYDPATGTWTETGAMRDPRSSHTTTVLPDGRVLVVGGLAGFDDEGLPLMLSSAELYDPARGTWTYTAQGMETPRSEHAAVLLGDGKVLVVGGTSGSADEGMPVLPVAAELFDPATGTWASAGSLSSGRITPTATLLPGGRVLVVGGIGPSAEVVEDGEVVLVPTYPPEAELYDPGTGWSRTGALASGRVSHTATLLPTGKVLVLGGTNRGGLLAAVDLYDPTAGTWAPTGSLPAGRYGHSATLLPDGTVLAFGGQGENGPLAASDRYDPNMGTWSATGALGTPRYLHSATLLPDGTVLAAGGSGPDDLFMLDSAERFQPPATTTVPGGATTTVPGGTGGTTTTTVPGGAGGTTTTTTARGGGGGTTTTTVPGGGGGTTTTTVPGGGGGTTTTTVPGAPTTTTTTLPGGPPAVTGVSPASAPSPDETTVTITGTGLTGTTAVRFGPRPAVRYEEVLVNDGKDTEIVAVAPPQPAGPVPVTVTTPGGTSAPGAAATFTYVDPAGGTWAATESLRTARSGHTATLLGDGKVLVVGGLDGEGKSLASSEVYDPAGGTWSRAGSLATPRSRHTATLLPDNRVLVVGGLDGEGQHVASAELYDPAAGTWSPAGFLTAARSGHTASLLPDGRLLVVGGEDEVALSTTGISFATAELYDPASGTWIPTGALATGRAHHTATVLADGRVLVVGGYRGFSFDEKPEGPLAQEAELFEPGAGRWSTVQGPAILRLSQTATLLADGTVLVAGGYPSNIETPSAAVELFDPVGTWSPARGLLGMPRARHTATLLSDGRVVAVGGVAKGKPLQSAELYDSTTRRWSYTGSLAGARRDHTATLLAGPASACGANCGKVLVVGGSLKDFGGDPIAAAELYTADTRATGAGVPPTAGGAPEVGAPAAGAPADATAGAGASDGRASRRAQRQPAADRRDTLPKTGGGPGALAGLVLAGLALALRAVRQRQG